MPTMEKINEVALLQDKMSRAKSAVLSDFRGLTVSQVTKLRNKLRAAGVDYKVSKNTLLTIAAKNVGIEGLDDYLKGPTAVAYSYDDPVLPAKLIAEFAKEAKLLQIKAGFLNGKALSAAQVTALANLPAKEVLIAKLLGTLNAPATNLVGILTAPTRSLVYALEAVRKAKGGQ